jgi:D-alanyl-D-alanine carboxypeptidase (penicillin-binding protein 5/6)
MEKLKMQVNRGFVKGFSLLLLVLVVSVVACIYPPMVGIVSSVYAEGDDGIDFSKAPNMTSDYYLLIEPKSGQILFSKNENEKRAPASTTKIMTALLALEKLKPETIITIDSETEKASLSSYGGMYLTEGEEISVKDLMYAMLVASANDAAVALARAMAGDINRFAEMMNERAVKLGANNTHFVNPNGLPDEDHYTTAYDLYLIAKEAMKDESFREYVSTVDYTIPKTNKRGQRTLKTLNRMLYDDTHQTIVYSAARPIKYEGATGIKTGTTNAAGHCLVGSATQKGMDLITVVLGAREKYLYADTEELLEYGFHNYEVLEVFSTTKAAKVLDVKSGAKDKIDVMAESDLFSVVPEGTKITDLQIKYDLPKEVTAPIAKDAVLGKAVVSLGDAELASVNLVAGTDMKQGSLSKVWHASTKFLSVVLKVVIGIVIVFVAWVVIAIVRSERGKRGRRRKNMFSGSSDYTQTREVSRIKRIK